MGGSTLVNSETISVAVVVGQHSFDVPGFYELLRGISGIVFYPQTLDNFVADFGNAQHQYDVVVFYNYHQSVEEGVEAAVEALIERGQGIVVWHHGLVAFPRWSLWSDICGIADRTFTAHKVQRLRVEVASADHPIAAGLTGWELTDETYAMASAGEGGQILLTTDHPRSMSTLAWTRLCRGTRVFCYQSGHDRRVYRDRSFRTVLGRGVRWAARSLDR